MASGTVSASSTYQSGKGISFARDIGSRVLNAAQAAKNEKKLQEKIEREGGEVPESAKKGLFAKALKQEFVSNPVNNLKKSLNKKIGGAANVVGLFGGKGRSLEDKILGKRFSVGKGGFDRSGYKKAGSDNNDGPSGGGSSGGGPITATLGSLVLDIQAIASAISSMQGLINTQMNISAKMADNLDEIKNVLSEQVSLQQQRIDGEERAAAEASLEASQQVSGTAKATSAFTEGNGLFDIFGQLQGLLGMLKNLPELFKGMFKNLIEKLPFGKTIGSKLFGKTAVKGGTELAEAGGKKMIAKVFGKIFKPIPIVGGLIDFAINLALGEPVGRAAASAVGSTLGAALGTLIPVPGVGTIAGALLGDWVGGTLYDWISGMAAKPKKMAAGGVMIGEAGKEAVVDLNSAQGRKQFGGTNAGDVDSAGQAYYSAIAGTTLAVTKEFVEGMGPIGASVAPAIQDDISKLGKTFDLPATSIKMSVGGVGLSPVPGAEKKGEEFLKKLVSGTLEKVKPDEKNKTTGGNGTGSSPQSSIDQTSPSAAAAGAQGAGSVDQKRSGATQAMNAGQQSQTAGNFSSTLEDRNGAEVKFTGPNSKPYKVIINATNGDYEVFEDWIFGQQVDISGDKNAPIKKAAMNQVRAYFVNNAPQKGLALKYITQDDIKNKAKVTQDASQVQASSGVSVLTKLGDGARLASAPVGRCVTGVLETMSANNVPNPQGTSNDPNNPRGLAAQLIKSYGWGSIGGLGKKINLKSPYGNVGANAMSFGEWKEAVTSNKIPSGSIIFTTRNSDWSGNQSSGHDAAIAQKGGRKLWSGHPQAQVDGVGAVYGTASQNIIALTPGGEQIPYNGSTSSDTGENKAPEDPFEAIERGLQGMLAGATTIAENSQGVESARKRGEDAANNMSSTGNVTTPSTPSANNRTTGGLSAGVTPRAGSPAIVPLPTGSSTPQSLSRSTTPNNTPANLAPVRP